MTPSSSLPSRMLLPSPPQIATVDACPPSSPAAAAYLPRIDAYAHLPSSLSAAADLSRNRHRCLFPHRPPLLFLSLSFSVRCLPRTDTPHPFVSRPPSVPTRLRFVMPAPPLLPSSPSSCLPAFQPLAADSKHEPFELIYLNMVMVYLIYFSCVIFYLLCCRY